MSKDRVVSIRLTQEEYENLKKEAEFYRRSVSDHIRARLRPRFVNLIPGTNTTATVGTTSYMVDWGRNGN